MSKVVKIACIQQHAENDREDNLQRGIEAYEKAARQGARIIIFPELAFTHFYPQKPAGGDILGLAETIPGPTTRIFSDLSRQWNAVTVLNLFEKKEHLTFDSSPVIDTDGTLLGVTRMVHIIEAPCFHEQGYYTPGQGDRMVFDTKLCKIGIAICYDRHFPEYMRTLALRQAELVAVPQAGAAGEWPPGVFEAEMQTAAFQNGYFVALCNRVGAEDCLTFEGKSFVTAPDGRIIDQAPEGKDSILISEIDLEEINRCHARAHFLRDRRPDIYRQWNRSRKKTVITGDKR